MTVNPVNPAALSNQMLVFWQTVLNTMCGYGVQQADERSAGQDVFTGGCLETIVWWARNNLLLVAGLTAGLLLLEVRHWCDTETASDRIRTNPDRTSVTSFDSE